VTTTADLRDQLADREAIRECLYSYCRGVDRVDVDLLATLFAPQATVTNSMFQGTAADWIESLPSASRPNLSSHHLVGNVLIDLTGDSADVEAYWTAHLQIANPGGGANDLALGGRYLDTMTRADGRWRIATHTIKRDWARSSPSQG
jgi:ketosteroid isomerase-like protein